MSAAARSEAADNFGRILGWAFILFGTALGAVILLALLAIGGRL